MEVFDWLLGDDMDLAIEAGDFLFGESTEQHQRDLLLATKGCFRQSPLVGVGIRMELLNDIGADEFRRLVQQEFERDGMSIDRFVVNVDGTFNIQAAYAGT